MKTAYAAVCAGVVAIGVVLAVYGFGMWEAANKEIDRDFWSTEYQTNHQDRYDYLQDRVMAGILLMAVGAGMAIFGMIAGVVVLVGGGKSVTEVHPPLQVSLARPGGVSFCSTCGHQIIQESIYCPKCGRRLSSNDE